MPWILTALVLGLFIRGGICQLLLDDHNTERGSVGASNMNRLEWDSDLYALAQGWANGCVGEHGQLPNSYPGSISQNLYGSNAPSVSADIGFGAWTAEQSHYDYDTNTCAAGQQCGHYTQIVWANTKYVGCASATCAMLERFNGTNISGALYLVCNYSPGGNLVGSQPYLSGDACSDCSNGLGWCNNSLCDNSCTEPSPSCACALTCRNGGTLITDECKCNCSNGFRGNQCEIMCEDDPACGVYTTTSCTSSLVSDLCPVLCGTCVYDGVTTATATTATTKTTTSTTTPVPPTTTRSSAPDVDNPPRLRSYGLQPWGILIIIIAVVFLLVGGCVILIFLSRRGKGPRLP